MSARQSVVSLCESMEDEIESGNIESYEPPVTHYFSDGVYCREMFMPKGVLVVGKIHKTAHMVIISKGDVSVRSQFYTDRFVASYTYRSPVGDQRAIYAHEDSVWTTIHPTNETDPEKIEEAIIAKDHYEIDRLDYFNTIAEIGIEENRVRQISDNVLDLIKMPENVVPYRLGPSHIEGTGYYLASSAKKGDVLAPSVINGKRTDAGRYVNHSAAPNSIMIGIGNNANLIALHDIEEGDEVTLSYKQVSSEVSQ